MVTRPLHRETGRAPATTHGAAPALPAAGLSADKTSVVHVDEGFDFLGWRIQRRRKRGTGQRFLYTYPSKKALLSVTGKVPTLTPRARDRLLPPDPRWRVSTAKTTPLVMNALEQALFTRRRGNAAFTATGLIHHSDAGAQYTSLAFTEALLGRCAAESRSGRGWPPADRLVEWVMATARASKIAWPGEVITGPTARDPAAGAASPSRFGDVKAGRAVQPVPEGSNEAEEKGDVREEICP